MENLAITISSIWILGIRAVSLLRGCQCLSLTERKTCRMSKLDHIAEGRAQGIAFALKICKEAQKDGEDPVAALEKEMTYRYKTKIVVLATRKELDQASEQIKAVTIKTVLAACMIVLWERFGFGGIRLKRLSEAFMVYIRALCEGSVTWWDITETLKEKTGIEIDLSDENIAGKVRAE